MHVRSLPLQPIAFALCSTAFGCITAITYLSLKSKRSDSQTNSFIIEENIFSIGVNCSSTLVIYYRQNTHADQFKWLTLILLHFA